MSNSEHTLGLNLGRLRLQESASVPGGAPSAGEGKIWIKNDTPASLQFTDDTGADHKIVESAYVASANQRILPLGSGGTVSADNSTIVAGSGTLSVANSSILSGTTIDTSALTNARTNTAYAEELNVKTAPQYDSLSDADSALPRGHAWRLTNDNVLRFVHDPADRAAFLHLWRMGDNDTITSFPTLATSMIDLVGSLHLTWKHRSDQV